MGFVFSTLGGHFVLWPLIDKFLWPYVSRKHNFRAHKFRLSWLVGIIERGLYTGALIAGAREWIGVWLAVKVVARWQTEGEKPPDSDNIWLIGTALSVLFGFLGAWIALGTLPIRRTP